MLTSPFSSQVGMLIAAEGKLQTVCHVIGSMSKISHSNSAINICVGLPRTVISA